MRRVEHHYERLRAALRRGVKIDLLAWNPIEKVKPPKVSRKEQSSLDPRQARTLTESLAGSPLYAPVATTLGCGMRRGELLRLTWDDLDLDARRASR